MGIPGVDLERIVDEADMLVAAHNAAQLKKCWRFLKELHSHTDLQSLNLAQIDFYTPQIDWSADEHFVRLPKIMDAIKAHSALRILNLTYGKIGARGAELVGEVLRVNTVLQNLDLSNNGIGDGGAELIGEALRVNTVLLSLDLSHNEIDNAGVTAITRALANNSVLTSLSLMDNNFGDEEMRPIGKLLRRNNKLRIIGLGLQAITNVGMRYIEEGLRLNTAVISLQNFRIFSTFKSSPDCEVYLERNANNEEKKERSLYHTLSEVLKDELGSDGQVVEPQAVRCEKRLLQAVHNYGPSHGQSSDGEEAEPPVIRRRDS